MIRVVVVDDEPLARSGVVARLGEHADIELVGEYGDGSTALDGIVRHGPDLAFVDVEMPGMSGLDLLGSLSVEERPMAIMLTAYDNFAIDAFALHAIDYLLKPIDDLRFAEALDRARQALPYRRRGANPHGDRPGILERFTVRVGMKTVLVDATDVDWVEADGDYAVLHAGEEIHLIREPLHRLVRRLDPRQFVRVHRSAIVRLDRITEIKAMANRDALLRLRDGTPLRASRTYIDALSAALGRTTG
jgi:two-component system LytT family response regulator